MTIDGAIVREQGVVFGIITVKPHVTDDRSRADEFRTWAQGKLAEFSGLPLILASQDSRGVYAYQGRPDIVSFLAGLDPAQIPWRRYTY